LKSCRSIVIALLPLLIHHLLFLHPSPACRHPTTSLPSPTFVPAILFRAPLRSPPLDSIHANTPQVCDNVGDHLMGNVYARYEWEAEAAKAVSALNDRWYAMKPLHCELSPVSDFREACCRQNELGTCTREG
jgi:hypothetical protein